MNNITDLLDLEDSDIKISDIIIEGQTKTLIIETPPVASYCPICGFRMHSRGVKKRTINHPILGVLPVKRTMKNNNFFSVSLLTGWRYFYAAFNVSS